MSSNETVVFPGPREVTLETSERPEPAADEVLVRTTKSLISTGTELTILSGKYPEDSHWSSYAQYPFRAGYSAIGEVTAAGTDVDEDIVGTTVALGRPHARYHTTSPDRCVPVPEIPDEEASFFNLAGIAMNGVRRGRLDWGETAVVYGCGLVGQLAARFCHVAGARPVVAVDIAEDRLAYLPADDGIHALNPETDDPVETVRSLAHDRLADVVLEVTGNPAVIPDEFDVLQEPLGRLVILSSPRDETSLDLHDYCNSPSYEIIGAHNSSHPRESTPHAPWSRPRHYELFFDLIDGGNVDVESLITHRIDAAEAPEMYQRLLEDRSQALGVVLDWTGE